MNLIIWRHAEVEPSMLPDLMRELSPEGHANAAACAALLDQLLPADCKVLCSPAKRAQQTVAPLPRAVEIIEALAPRSTVSAFKEALDWPNFVHSEQSKLIVSHQPTCGMLIADLIWGRTADFEVHNCHAYWISNEGEQLYVRGVINGQGARWLKNPLP